jgi:hypothetical protein
MLNTRPNMLVNVTHEEFDEVMVIVNSERCRSGDTSHLAAKLKELAKKNGGNFDYRMALLGVITDLKVIDTKVKHIKSDVKIDMTDLPTSTKVKEHFFGKD